MEKQKSILKKLLYIIIVMMLCWIYNGYNRSLEYLISSADIDWRYIYAKESNVNPLDYRNSTIFVSGKNEYDFIFESVTSDNPCNYHITYKTDNFLWIILE